MKIQKLDKRAKLPTRGSEYAAGYDLYALLPEGTESVIINPGEKIVFSTGIAVEIPTGYFGGVYARSGLSTKRGLRPTNCTGVIDSDYRGDVMVGLYNDSAIPQEVCAFERIAQLIIQPYLAVALEEVDELTDTDRGDGGFGSSGRK